MFSVKQKREIADAVQKILRATNHPELPNGDEIAFTLHVDGAERWSWADIQNNGAVLQPGVNPWNERQAQEPAAPLPASAALQDKIQRIIERERRLIESESWRQATAEALIDELAAALSRADQP